MSVKMFLMWNSRMIIDGGGDQNVETTMLEASNLIVLKVLFLFPLLVFLGCLIVLVHFEMSSTCHLMQESSQIRSNANLGVHGQGLLNLSGPGDAIEAQRLVLSLFYSVNVSRNLVLSPFVSVFIGDVQ